MYSAIAWGGPAHGQLIQSRDREVAFFMRDNSVLIRPPKAPPDTRTRWQRFVNALTGVCPPPEPVIEKLPVVKIIYCLRTFPMENRYSHLVGSGIYIEVWLPETLAATALTPGETRRMIDYVRSRLREIEDERTAVEAHREALPLGDPREPYEVRRGPCGRPLCPKCRTEEGVHGGCRCGHLSARL